MFRVIQSKTFSALEGSGTQTCTKLQADRVLQQFLVHFLHCHVCNRRPQLQVPKLLSAKPQFPMSERQRDPWSIWNGKKLHGQLLHSLHHFQIDRLSWPAAAQFGWQPSEQLGGFESPCVWIPRLLTNNAIYGWNAATSTRLCGLNYGLTHVQCRCQQVLALQVAGQGAHLVWSNDIQCCAMFGNFEAQVVFLQKPGLAGGQGQKQWRQFQVTCPQAQHSDSLWLKHDGAQYGPIKDTLVLFFNMLF